MGSDITLDKIKTIEDAKELYFKYECSGFRIYDNEGDGFQEIEARFSITPEMKRSWRKEYFEILHKQLIEEGDYSIFSRMCDVIAGIKEKEVLDTIVSALKDVHFKNDNEKEMACEEIIGRGLIEARGGFIFMAYDLGEEEIAKYLIRYTKKILTDESMEYGEIEGGKERFKMFLKAYIEELRKICKEINYDFDEM